MAFTVKGEYDRLTKIKEKCERSLNIQLPFESGVVCGVVTRIEYLPRQYNMETHSWMEEECQIYVIAGWDTKEQLAFTLMTNDVRLRYQDRKYRFNKRYNILEYFPYN